MTTSVSAARSGGRMIDRVQAQIRRQASLTMKMSV